MFVYQWENREISVELKPDNTFAQINFDQREQVPSAETISQVLSNQERFQEIEYDKEDLRDIIEGQIQFYELQLKISDLEWDVSLHYIYPARLLSRNNIDQENDIAYLLEDTHALEYMARHLRRACSES